MELREKKAASCDGAMWRMGPSRRAIFGTGSVSLHEHDSKQKKVISQHSPCILRSTAACRHVFLAWRERKIRH